MVDIIKQEDIPTLFDLAFKAHQGQDYLIVANTILDVFKRDFRAYKLEVDNKMVGYCLGYRLTADVFYFVDIFVLEKYRKYAGYLVKYVEADVAKDFKAWLSNAVTEEGKKLLDKLGERIK